MVFFNAYKQRKVNIQESNFISTSWKFLIQRLDDKRSNVTVTVLRCAECEWELVKGSIYKTVMLNSIYILQNSTIASWLIISDLRLLMSFIVLLFYIFYFICFLHGIWRQSYLNLNCDLRKSDVFKTWYIALSTILNGKFPFYIVIFLLLLLLITSRILLQLWDE